MGKKKGKKKPDIFWTRKVGKKRAKRSLTFFGSHHMSGFFLPTFMSRSQMWAKRSLGKKKHVMGQPHLLHYPIHEYRKSSQHQVRVRHELRVGGGAPSAGGQADPAALQTPRPHTISNAGRHRSAHQESGEMYSSRMGGDQRRSVTHQCVPYCKCCPLWVRRSQAG